MKVKKHNPSRLRDFRGVDLKHVAKLEACGLKTAEQLLMVAATRAGRGQLAKETGVPEAILLELVRLADLSRLPGVKGIRARLYLDAGVDSIETMAGWETPAQPTFSSARSRIRCLTPGRPTSSSRTRSIPGWRGQDTARGNVREDDMRLQTVFTINFPIAVFFGLACSLIPGFVGQVYGLPADDASIWVTRLVGGSILGFSTLMWFGRRTESRQVRRAIALALLIQDTVGLAASLEIQLGGRINALGWTNPIIYGVLALAYARILFQRE